MADIRFNSSYRVVIGIGEFITEVGIINEIMPLNIKNINFDSMGWKES